MSRTDHLHYRVCPLCEATCGLEVAVDNGKVRRIRGDREDPFSAGFICPKGSTLGHLQEDPDWLRRPLIRRDGVHVQASFDEAFAYIADRLADSDFASNERGVYLGIHRRSDAAAYLKCPDVRRCESLRPTRHRPH